MNDVRKAIITLLLLASGSALLLHRYIANLPDMQDKDQIKMPRSLDDLRDLQKILQTYQTSHGNTVLALWASVFIFLQSFAIPGSVFLSILAGSLFSVQRSLVYVCACSTIGSTIGYLLSSNIGTPIVRRYFSDRVKQVREMVGNQKSSDGPFSTLPPFLFLRITPILPNWLVTLAAPHVGIPLGLFMIGTFLGVMPVSYLHVSAGQALDSLTSSDVSILTPKKLLGIFAIGALPLVLQRMNSK